MANNDTTPTLDSILKQLNERHAAEVAQTVRGYLGRLIGTESHAPAAAPVAAAPVKRKPGRPAKVKPAVEAAASAPPAAAKPGKRRKPGKIRRLTDAELNVVLSVIKAKPGLTSVQIQKEAGIDGKQAARVMTKLRKTGRVKIKGAKSAATYTIG